MGKSLLSYCDKSCILNFLCYVLQVGSTGKRSKPALNKNGGCLYIVAIVSEKNLILRMTDILHICDLIIYI